MIVRHLLLQTGFTGPHYIPGEENILNIPSAYEQLDDWAVKIQFQDRSETITIDPVTQQPKTTYTYVDPISISSDYDFPSIGVTMTPVNNSTIQLAGKLVNVLNTEFYEFRMADYSVRHAPSNTVEPFFSLVHYNMPQPTFQTEQYPFNIQLTSGMQAVNVEQVVWWSYQVAKANVLSLVQRGMK